MSESKTTDQLTEAEQEEIAQKIKEGFTSGLFDSEGNTISWNLLVEKFKN